MATVFLILGLTCFSLGLVNGLTCYRDVINDPPSLTMDGCTYCAFGNVSTLPPIKDYFGLSRFCLTPPILHYYDNNTKTNFTEINKCMEVQTNNSHQGIQIVRMYICNTDLCNVGCPNDAWQRVTPADTTVTPTTDSTDINATTSEITTMTSTTTAKNHGSIVNILNVFVALVGLVIV